MAQRRMIHKSISYSRQVNTLLSSDFTRLVFTWGIPHLDDFGKIDGEADVFKAIVMPMINASTESVEKALLELVETGLVERYEVNGKLILHYINFDKYQIGLNKRTRSRYPNKDGSYEEVGNFLELPGNSLPTEANKINLKQPKLKNANIKEKVAGKSFSDPNNYPINNADELAALEAWRKLEPENKLAFFTTYLWAVKQGVKADSIYRFTSEIHQDKTVENKGSVFQSKVKSIIK